VGWPDFGQRRRTPERPAARHSGKRRGALRGRWLGREAAVQQGTRGRLLPFYWGVEHETPSVAHTRGRGGGGVQQRLLLSGSDGPRVGLRLGRCKLGRALGLGPVGEEGLDFFFF
jgi:hypothetical protein